MCNMEGHMWSSIILLKICHIDKYFELPLKDGWPFSSILLWFFELKQELCIACHCHVAGAKNM